MAAGYCGQALMNYSKQTINSAIKVHGIMCRTTNADNKAAIDMKQLWERFFAERILEQLEKRSNTNIVSIYTNYESGYEGAYSAILGSEVESGSELPNGFVEHIIETGEYLVIEIDNPTPDRVVAAWIEIWKANDKLSRTFVSDFEIYYSDNNGMPNRAEIFLSI